MRASRQCQRNISVVEWGAHGMSAGPCHRYEYGQ